MGDFTLGCLLGQYDKAQSFDVTSAAITSGVNSWSRSLVVSAYFMGNSVGGTNPPDTGVHRSAQGLNVEVFSHASNFVFFEYNHSEDNDSRARAFPGVSTHDIFAMAFAYHNNATQDPFNLQLFADVQLGTAIQGDFGGVTGLQLVKTPTLWVSSLSGETPRVSLKLVSNITVQNDVYVDDVLTQINPITLNPEYSFREKARTIKSQHRTMRGDLHSYVWDKYFAYSVPLRYLPTSHADLINWWWENQFNLAFTLDTFDSESTFICRITNDRQPIGGRIRPYNDQWQGVLQLESINKGSLVF